MPVATAELVSLQRSAAMLTPGQSMSIERDVLYELCGEVLEAWQLLARLGADLKTVAAKAPQSTPGGDQRAASDETLDQSDSLDRRGLSVGRQQVEDRQATGALVVAGTVAVVTVPAIRPRPRDLRRSRGRRSVKIMCDPSRFVQRDQLQTPTQVTRNRR